MPGAIEMRRLESESSDLLAEGSYDRMNGVGLPKAMQSRDCQGQ